MEVAVGSRIFLLDISRTVYASEAYGVPKYSPRQPFPVSTISVSGFDHFRFRFAVFRVFPAYGRSERERS